MGKAKTLLRSKTFWFNLLAAGLSLGMAKAGVSVDPGLQGTILGVANMGLRLVTSKAVSLTGNQ